MSTTTILVGTWSLLDVGSVVWSAIGPHHTHADRFLQGLLRQLPNPTEDRELTELERERLAALLEASGDARVLTRALARRLRDPTRGASLRLGNIYSGLDERTAIWLPSETESNE